MQAGLLTAQLASPFRAADQAAIFFPRPKPQRLFSQKLRPQLVCLQLPQSGPKERHSRQNSQLLKKPLKREWLVVRGTSSRRKVYSTTQAAESTIRTCVARIPSVKLED